MLKYLVMFVAVLGGLVNLFLAWLLLPALAVGLWQTDWDPRRLSAEQKIFEMGHRLPALWATRHPIDRGRYALAFYRFQSVMIACGKTIRECAGCNSTVFAMSVTWRFASISFFLARNLIMRKNPRSLNLMKILESAAFGVGITTTLVYPPATCGWLH